MATRDLALRVKRVIDVVGATLAGVLLSPVIGAAAFAVRLNLGRPILFRQERPGKGGSTFTLYKLRTMTEATNDRGESLSDEIRATPVGRTLRRWSIDELPELWNVMKGDMSLVGPRPLLVDYLPLYSDEQARRHDMRPGITGLAQVSGRNDQTWEDRLALDVFYVDNWSLCLDVRIVARTLGKVLTGEGVSSPGLTTMQRFRGASHE